MCYTHQSFVPAYLFQLGLQNCYGKVKPVHSIHLYEYSYVNIKVSYTDITYFPTLHGNTASLHFTLMYLPPHWLRLHES